MSQRTVVLVVGGTGLLGGKVVQELIDRGKPVRALVRPGSDPSQLLAAGADIARGDMLDPWSLLDAMEGVDAVISTAAGYTRRQRNATAIDTVGYANLAEAAQRAEVRRFVLTSILTCDQTPQVPHFWHKKQAEDRLEKLGVPFVALRPGAFLDQLARSGADPFRAGRLTWFGSPDVPMTFVLTSDVAGYLAAAVDALGVDGQRIEIGWDRPVSLAEIAEISGRLLDKPIATRTIPARPLSAVGTVLRPVLPFATDLARMVAWFQTGRYVADTTRQGEVFGTVPAAEDAIARFIASLGHPIRA